MNQKKKTARLAGLYYLIMAATGPLGLMLVPSKIIVSGDPAATVQNVISNEFLLRIGIISNLICQISFIFLVLALYRLFKETNGKYSKLMVSLVIAAVPIAIFNEVNYTAVLILVKNSYFLKAFGADQLNSLIMLFLNLHGQGEIIASVFWGLWLFPFGYLVIKSGFIPKILGILLMVGCFSYLIDSSFAILIPQHRDIITNILMLPLSAGELSMVFWLLIKGVNEKSPIKI